MSWFAISCVPCLNKRRDLLGPGVKYLSAKEFCCYSTQIMP